MTASRLFRKASLYFCIELPNLGHVSERNSFRFKFEQICLKTVTFSIFNPSMNNADFRNVVLVTRAQCKSAARAWPVGSQ
jgi:hypothetical protein